MKQAQYGHLGQNLFLVTFRDSPNSRADEWVGHTSTPTQMYHLPFCTQIIEKPCVQTIQLCTLYRGECAHVKYEKPQNS